MNSRLALILTGASLFASTSLVSAQTVVLDTIGKATQWGIGSNSTTGQFIGDDPGTRQPYPKTAAGAGYAVMPFTLTNAFQGAVSSVDIVMNILSPSGTEITSNLNSLYGAFFAPSFDGQGRPTLSAAAELGDFFQFNTKPAGSSIPPPGRGDNKVHILSSKIKGYQSLLGGNTYWLVIAPKDGLNAQDSDPLLHLGIWENRTQSQVNISNGSLTTKYGTVGQGLWEYFNGAGAQANNFLHLDKAASGTPLYFGARITAVPEPASWMAMLLGVSAVGLGLRRRRQAH